MSIFSNHFPRSDNSIPDSTPYWLMLGQLGGYCRFIHRSCWVCILPPLSSRIWWVKANILSCIRLLLSVYSGLRVALQASIRSIEVSPLSKCLISGGIKPLPSGWSISITLASVKLDFSIISTMTIQEEVGFIGGSQSSQGIDIRILWPGYLLDLVTIKDD